MAPKPPSKDPALDAIYELGDTVENSFQVIEKDIRAEMSAGFKAHSARIAAVERGGPSSGSSPSGSRYSYSGHALAPALDEIGFHAARILDCGGLRVQRADSAFNDSLFAAGVARLFQVIGDLQRSRVFDPQKAELRDKLMQAFQELGNYQKAAMLVTGTTDLGGHWLPDPVANELYRLITDNSSIAPLATHVPMTTKTLDLPTEGSSSLAVSWGTEGATNITDSVPANNATNKVTLTAARLNGWAEASLEEVQDSPISILAWVLQKLTEQSGREIDAQCLGEGATAQFTGLRTLSGVGEMSGSGANGVVFPTFQGFINQVFKGRERAARKGAYWFLSPEAAALVAGMRADAVTAADNAGLPLFQYASGMPGDISGQILGFPAVVHSVISAARTYGTGTGGSTIYFGPPSQFVIGDRMGMSWDMSDLPNFRQATIQMRLITRLAIGVAVPAAFARASNVKTV